MTIEHVAGIVLLGFLLPLWLVFGVTDWWRHKATFIESTSGWRESGLHLLLVGQAGVAALAGLFFEINALILGLAILAYLAHELTTNLDVHYASHRRMITSAEQRVHDYLTAIPFAVLVAVCIINPGQFAALFGAGTETADFSLRWKEEPLPTWYLATWLVVSPINALLYLEEFIRCLRQHRQRIVTV
jgi:uncharacterized membrane protein